MNPSPHLIRRLVVALCVALALGWARDASARGQGSILSGCKKWRLEPTGPTTGDDKVGSVSGAVIFECDGTSIFAERIWWTPTTISAEGDLLVTQDGLRVNADRMEMDRQTRLGTFFNAYGTARLTEKPSERSMFGTMEPEVWFKAERVERMGPRSYKLTNGVFSTCVQPTARWEMRGTTGTVILDDHVALKNVQFRVKGVPVLYLPYLYYPLKKDDRASGILMPAYSSSSVRGQGISNAVFWAIDRSQDATIFYDLFSKTGQGLGGEYRYVAAPESRGQAKMYVLFEKERIAADGTVERAGGQSYTIDGNVHQSLGGSFRLDGWSNYTSDITAQQLYQQNVADLANRNQRLGIRVDGTVLGSLRLRALAERNDLYTGATAVGRAVLPQIAASYDKSVKKAWFSTSGEVVHFESRDPANISPVIAVSRFDSLSSVRAPLSSLRWLTLTTTAAWHITRWLDSLDPITGLPVPVPITRNLLDLRADAVGPKVERVFQTPTNGYAMRFKHLIVPRVTVQYVSPFTQQRDLIKMDHVDQIVDTMRVNYSLANEVLVRRRTPDGKGQVRPFLSAGIGQTYYSNQLAGTVDPQYPTGTAGTFSPIQVTASVTPIDEVSGQFWMYINPIAKVPQSFSASTNIRAKRVDVTAGWSKTQYLPGMPGFNDPNAVSHAVNASAGFNTVDGRAGGRYGFNLDLQNQRLIQQRVTVYYHAQCCGIAFDYQTINVSNFQISGVPADRRMTVSFTLAGIGSFAPPLGAFGR